MRSDPETEAALEAVLRKADQVEGAAEPPPVAVGSPPRPPHPPLRGGAGGGTPSGMEDWKASVDRQLQTLHEDVRRLLSPLIGGAILVTAAQAGLYLYTRSKVDNLHNQVSQVQNSQTKMQGDLETRDARLAGKMDVLLERVGSSKTGESER